MDGAGRKKAEEQEPVDKQPTSIGDRRKNNEAPNRTHDEPVDPFEHDPMNPSGPAAFITLAAFCLTLFATASTVFAEPYMALREGYACGDCHTNRTGGGMRNLTVEMHGAEILNLPNDGDGLFPEVDERLSPHINDFLSVGGNFRLVDTLLFQDAPDATGRVDNNTAFREIESNDIDIQQGTLYAEIRLIPEYLSLYIDERVAPGGADNREAFGIVDKILPKEAYIKGGRFFPAFGLKLQDNRAFVNAHSGFSFDRSVTGVEVGRTGEGLNWQVSVSEGNEDNDLDQLVTGNAFYMWRDVGALTSVMLGGSAAYDEPDNNGFQAYTAYGGFAAGPLALLAQGVFLDTESATADDQSWAGYIEANWLFSDWINGKVAFDYTDPSDNASDDERNRVSIGIEPFIDEFLQLRLFYRVYNGPKTNISANRDELSVEAHLFF